MAEHLDHERRPLLGENGTQRSSSLRGQEALALLKDDIVVNETEIRDTSVGERLPYSDYTTIDQLHDLVLYPRHPLDLEAELIEALRSKTHTVYVHSTASQVFVTRSCDCWTLPLGGSLLLLQAV